MMTKQDPPRAEVVEEITRFNQRRDRCTVCDKVAFATEADAISAKNNIFLDRGVRMRHYKGRHPYQRRGRGGENKGRPCGWWHLTTSRKR